MRLPRLFVDLPLREGERIVLPPGRAHYLREVLRLRSGAELRLFNGKGGEFEARIVEAGRRTTVQVGPRRDREPEPPLAITVALGIARGERMDFALQKATELGVSRIVPLLTERTVVRLSGDRLERRMAHWRGVVASACEQCGRSRLPQLCEPVPIRSWLAREEGGFLLDPQGEPLRSAPPPPTAEAVLLIGPEGGFTPQERQLALSRRFRKIALGPRLLRVETAVVAAITACQLLWGDL